MKFSVFGQILPNLGSIVVKLVLDSHEPVKVTATSRFVRLEWKNQSWNIAELPFACNTSGLTTQQDGKEWTLRIRLAKDWKLEQNIQFPYTEDFEPFMTLKASMLNKEKQCIVSDLSCKQCQSSLRPKPFTKAIDLPSPYWYELFDSWICHEDQQLQYEKRLGFSHQDEPSMQPQDRLLIGGNGGGLLKCYKEQLDLSLDSNVVTCPNCLTHLGHFVNDTIVLHTPTINIHTSEKLLQFEAFTFFINDLLNLASSHANYKVLIADTESSFPFTLSKPRFVVWLFAWNGVTFTSNGKVTPSPIPPKWDAEIPMVGNQSTFATLKLMYHLLSPDDNLEQWLGQPIEKSDVLYYPSNIVDSLLSTLDNHQEKSFNQWNTSTVPRV